MKPIETLISELFDKREELTKTSTDLRTLQMNPIKLPLNANDYNSRQLDNVINYKRKLIEKIEHIEKLSSEIETLEKSLFDYFIEAELPVGRPIFSIAGKNEYRSNYDVTDRITIVKL